MNPIVPADYKEGSGHYVPGIMQGETLYISGQLPTDPQTGQNVSEDITEQTHAALKNVERVLEAAGMSLTDVVQCRVYIPDVAFWEAVNKEYARFFGSHKPARAIVPTRNLFNGAKIEIEAIAVRQ